MPTIKSLDPRVTRAGIDVEKQEMQPLANLECFETYEVFHQAKKGGRHTHVGSVHAPNPEMAFVFAKEQYGRRSKSVNLWIVRTTDIYTLAYEDTDMFETVPDKIYREASAYKIRSKIEKFKKEHGQQHDK